MYLLFFKFPIFLFNAIARIRAVDQRPSDLLRMIERILGRTVQGDEIATEEFITRLSERIQLIVRAQADIVVSSMFSLC